MRKYSIVFTLSFISYFIVLFAAPYITAQTWADLCFLIFLLSVIYQLCFLIILRKEDGMGIARGIARFFLHALQALSIYVIIQYGDMFVSGYIYMENIIFLPILFITFLYGLLYFIVGRSIESKK